MVKKLNEEDLWDTKVILDAYYRHSAALSTVLRQLIYAEGAIVWILLLFYKFTSLPCSAFFFYVSIFLFFAIDLAHYWYLTDKYSACAIDMSKNQQKEILAKIAEPKYQELFPYLKKRAAIISSILFLI